MSSQKWTEAQVIAKNTGDAVSVNPRIYANPVVGGECFYIDEIVLSHY